MLRTTASAAYAANWFEREAHDLYDGFEGFPGRKSFPFHDYDEW